MCIRDRVIAERIAGIDPRALQEKLQNVIQDEARTFRPHDAVGGLPPADKDELYRVDLSFTVTPELAKAVTDINGASIYPEGLRVNPLKIMAEKGIGYPFILVVLNADRPAELRWFKDTGYNDDPRVKLLITDGYPYEDVYKRQGFNIRQGQAEVKKALEHSGIMHRCNRLTMRSRPGGRPLRAPWRAAP